jgi:hypothetical protein
MTSEKAKSKYLRRGGEDIGEGMGWDEREGEERGV